MLLKIHPMTLPEALKTTLHQHGAIPFAQFMHLALYSPEFGYYTGSRLPIGRNGDFITAPELTPLFGQTLANACLPVLTALHAPIMLEFGAGSGRLCVDILSHLETQAALPESYYILEVSASLKARQAHLIHTEIPHLASRVQWLTQFPSQPFSGILIANEVLDAMPVHRIVTTDNGLYESYVQLTPEGSLHECFKPCTNPRLLAYVSEHLPDLPVPYSSEVNLFLDGWLQACSDFLDSGMVLLLDYGFPRHEYYHPDRDQGTLMAHTQHKAHADVFLNPGEQDITAHVDFTHVAEAGLSAGFNVSAYTNQASFLLAHGLLNLLDNLPQSPARTKATQAVKYLTHPSEMGELFKMMALTKGLESLPPTFCLYDKRASL